MEKANKPRRSFPKGYLKHLSPAVEARIRELNAAGWTDQEMVDGRHTGAEGKGYTPGLGSRWTVWKVKYWRKKLGLKAKRLKGQKRVGGAATVLASRHFAAHWRHLQKKGEPLFSPLEVRILDLLFSRQFLTRREMADALGVPWKDGAALRPCGHTALARLVSRGLVLVNEYRWGRTRYTGRGRPPNLYRLKYNAVPRGKDDS